MPTLTRPVVWNILSTTEFLIEMEIFQTNLIISADASLTVGKQIVAQIHMRSRSRIVNKDGSHYNTESQAALTEVIT